MTEEWQVKALGEVCHVVGGGTPSKKNAAFYEGDIPWATVRDMKEENLSHTEFCISKEAVQNSSTKIIPAGNVVIATRVGLGKVCLLNQDTAINQDLRGIIPNESIIDARYLFRWFQSVSDVIQDEGTGATVKGVKLPFIKSLKIPVPPLPEQKRIVAILDESFAGIEKAVANTEKNLVNARELFESYLKLIFSQQAEGWTLTTIGDQITLQRGFDITKKQQRPGIIPVVSSGGVKSYHDVAKVKGPGVVIGRKGSLGTAYYIADDFWPHDTVLWVKEFNGNHPKLVYFFLRALGVKNLDSGTANPALNRNMVHPIKVYWPTKALQADLVDKLVAISEYSEHLATIYQQKRTALAELKQSLLQKAFSGALTAKDNNTAKEAAA
jgi:type I restriction enzyme S subunit